jgi:adenylyltransferase/sulfurtransferase
MDEKTMWNESGPASAAMSMLSDERLDATADLDHDEMLRYSRHLIMPEVGAAGQKKLKAARVLCIGAGGLGSPVAMYLAAAGVGALGLVDFDVVEISNLQRQIIHYTEDVGRRKLDSAREKLHHINPGVSVELHQARLNASNALEILNSYDIIIDGTDNFPTRYLVNDACVLLKKPNVHGSVFRFEGMASVFDARIGPCYRCLYPEPPPPGLAPSCAEAGVLGVLPGLVGVIQATEAIKLILGVGEPLVGRLLLIDALKMQFRQISLRKNAGCPICGDNPSIHELTNQGELCTAQHLSADEWETGPSAVKDRLDRGDPFLLVDVRGEDEWATCHIEGAILMPLHELDRRAAELPRERDIVLYCRSGMRSARALEMLRQRGFHRLKNMVGGILAWTRDVDPSLEPH